MCGVASKEVTLRVDGVVSGSSRRADVVENEENARAGKRHDAERRPGRASSSWPTQASRPSRRYASLLVRCDHT